MTPCTSTEFRDFLLVFLQGYACKKRSTLVWREGWDMVIENAKKNLPRTTLATSAAQLASSCAGHFYGLRKETLIL